MANQLPPVTLTPAAGTAGPSPKPASGSKLVLSHAIAAVVGAAMGFGAPVVKDNWPSSAQPEIKKAEVADVKKPEIAKDEAKKPEAKVERSPYEVKVRAAYEVDPHGHQVYLKRLLYLYRGVLKDTMDGKTELEIRSLFVVEEKKLDFVGGMPVLRPIIVAEWHARYPANAPVDVRRESNIRFWKDTIGILERLL